MDELLSCRVVRKSYGGVSVLRGVTLYPVPLPAAMLADDAPVRSCVEFGEEIAFCCTGERLLAHVFAALN